MRTNLRHAVLLSITVAALGCGDSSINIENDELKGADESAEVGDLESALTGSHAVGSTLQTTANLNLRSGPSTGYSILRTMPLGAKVKLVIGTPSNSFYKVNHNGLVGWAHGGYLKLIASAAPTLTARDHAINRAKAGVGFSYWWGHGRWLGSGVTTSTRGSCVGSCPSCSHSGSYGADCSGYVAKIWQVPSTNTNLSVDSHPYSTWNFDNQSTSWTTISRSNLRRADALVYNTNGAGHIVLFESGDPWGSMWTYEARGCSDGIRHNIRTASSSYKAIRRNGY